MYLISWNAQGLNKSQGQNEVSKFSSSSKISLVGIIETRGEKM